MSRVVTIILHGIVAQTYARELAAKRVMLEKSVKNSVNNVADNWIGRVAAKLTNALYSEVQRRCSDLEGTTIGKPRLRQLPRTDGHNMILLRQSYIRALHRFARLTPLSRWQKSLLHFLTNQPRHSVWSSVFQCHSSGERSREDPSELALAAKLDLAALWLAEAESILFITGAGLSADSGLPTYRGVAGLYNDKNTSDGLPIEIALSASVFATEPAVTWKYILQIERACRGKMPNDGHKCLAWLEKVKPRVWVLTQNVDGFHCRVGSRHVIEMHGNLEELLCTRCSMRESVADYSRLDPLPRCAACGSVMRPCAVLFGERLPTGAMATYRKELNRGFDLIFTIGTTSLFPYIELPVLQAKSRGNRIVEINPGDTVVSDIVDLKIRLGAAKAMAGIRERLIATHGYEDFQP